jgi:YfiH family protein
MAWPAFDESPIDVLVTTREGGVSRGPYAALNLGLHVGDDDNCVVENRRRAAAAIGADLGDLVFATQVHGRGVAEVTSEHLGRGARTLASAIGGVDAFVTAETGPVLVMMVADCVPIVLYEPHAHVAAVVHSGWRGTAGRVLDPTLAAMTGLGARPANVIAGIGPAASPATYEVGPEVAEAVMDAFGNGPAANLLEPSQHDRFLLDLPAANKAILVAAGVPEQQVHVAPVATGERGPFFSDRAERPCGRFAVLARLR